MAIIRSFAGAAISKPGAYSDIKVQNLTGFPLQPTGIVGIVGEAVGGEPGVLDELSGPAIQAAKDKYKEGAIRDALGILTDPSKDERIANGASKVIVFKTNQSTPSILNLLNNAGTPVAGVKLTSGNHGDDENTLNAESFVEGSVKDLEAALEGTIDGPFDLSSGGDTLILVINGTTYTYTSTLTGFAETATAVKDDLNGANWAPSKPIVAALNGDKIDVAIDPAVLTDAKLDYGYLKVDEASTLDTILGIAGTNRGAKGSRFITLKKGSSAEEAIKELGGLAVVSILYTGAAVTCKLKIEDSLGDRKLTTDCAAVAADNLDLKLGVTENGELKPKLTIQQMVDVINGTGKYTATVDYSNPDLNAIELDYYTDLYIENVAGVLKRDVEDLVQFQNTLSELATAERISNIAGALATFTTPQFFAGGADGVSSNVDFINGFNALKLVRCNSVLPLISADKGSLSVDTINAVASSHVSQMWSTTGKSERNAFISKVASKADLKAAARTINSGYVSMLGQDPYLLSDSQNALAFLDPWAAGCVCAGLQAGSPVGEPITFKYGNVNDVRVRDGSWNPRIDYQEMIEAGVTFLEKVDSGGFRVVVGNTTYSKDGSFVWNRISVVEAAGYVAYDLRMNMETEFTGTKAKTGSAEAIANFVRVRMETYLNADIIVGDDDNAGLGFKNLKILLVGNTAIINVIVTPVQGIDFILPTIFLADIRQAA